MDSAGAGADRAWGAGLARAAAHGALAAWIAVAAGLLLGASVEASTQRALLLPDAERYSLLARELAALAGFAFAAGWALAWAWGLAAPRRRARWIAREFLGLVVLVPVGLYGASWQAFRSTGRFLDLAGVEFMAASPTQFFQHVAHIEPYLLVVAPVSLAAAIGVLTWGAAWIAARLGVVAQWTLALATVALVALAAGVATRDVDPSFDASLFVTDPDAGMVYSYGDLYADCRDERTGPVSHAWADVRRRARGGDELGLWIDPTIEVVERPIVALEDFTAKVDADAIHRWNVLLVIVESLRPDQLVVFGGERVVMPNLEELAAESVAYADHYTQASHSNYADLVPLSSHYPLRSRRVHVYPENPSYPRVLVYDVLKSLGWRTAIISSQNETWGGMLNYLQTGSVDHFFHSETYDGPTYVPRHDEGFADFLKGSKRSGKIDDRFTIDEAIRWTGSHDDGAPFFVYLNLQNSHLPYETPADFPRPFGPAKIPVEIRFGGYPTGYTSVVKDVYADSLAYSDHQLGRLFAELKRTGEWDRTLVVVTGDTGQAFGEHGFVAHANAIYEELMRVPLLIRAPGLAPAVDDRPAQHVDIAPTILDLLGIDVHPSFQGVSLLGAPDPDRSRYLMVQAPLAHQYGLVRGRFKLVYDVEGDATALRNLRADPHERRNLVLQRPALTEELRSRLDTWRQRQLDYYEDPRLHTRTYPPVLRD